MTEEMKNYIKKIREEIRNDGNWEKEFLKYKKYLEKNLEKNPKDVESVCQLAIVYLELNFDYEIFIQLLEDFLKKYSSELTLKEKVKIYINLAYFYEYEKEEIENCEKYLLKALRLDKKNSNIYAGLGKLYLSENRNKEALEFFETMKRKNIEQSVDTQYNYSVALIKNRKFESAKKILKNLIKEKAIKKTALVTLSFCCYKLNLKNEALEYLRKAENTGNFDMYGEINFAEMYYLLEKYEKCVNFFEKRNFGYFEIS